MGVFRSPDEEGPLSNVTLLQEEKARLLEVVHRGTVYTAVQPKDFQPGVSAGTQVFLMDAASSLDGDIALEVEKAALREDERLQGMLDGLEDVLAAAKLYEQVAATLPNMTSPVQDGEQLATLLAPWDEMAAHAVGNYWRRFKALQVRSVYLWLRISFLLI